MAHPQQPGPKTFVLTAGESSDALRITAVDAQEASVVFRDFFRDGEAEMYTIDDESTGQRLTLEPGRGILSRVDPAKNPSTDYLSIDRPNRFRPAATLFFENGCAGLDNVGRWNPDRALVEGPPDELGAAWAAMFTTESAALEEMGRMWADQGYIDPSDRFVVFFDSRSLDEGRAERAELLVLIDVLGLERVDTPAEATPGEVWVRREARLDAELEQWG